MRRDPQSRRETHRGFRRLGRIGCLLLALCLLLPVAGAAAEEETAAGDTLRVGWVPRAHMTEVKDGVYSGYNYDFLMALSEYTGWQYEFVVGDIGEMSAMLERGEIDLLGSLLYSEERAEKFDFPALASGEKYTVLFTAEGSPLGAYDFAAFDGLRIGSLRADEASRARLKEFADDGGFTYTDMLYDDAESFAAAIHGGEADAGVVDAYMDTEGFRILAEFSPVPYYFATTKGNDKVLHALNRALWQLNLERPYIERELYDRHFGIHFDETLTEQELALVEATVQKPVVVGVIPSSEPACYWDGEKGEFCGIVMEILGAVSEKTGLCFTYVPVDLSLGAPIAQLRAGYPDVVAGVIRTQRFLDDDTLVLSNVLMNDSLVMVGRKGDDFTHDAADRSIACLRGFQAAEEYLEETFPAHTIAPYATAGECLDALAAGKVDAAIYSRTCLNYLMHNPRYEKLETLPAYYRDVDTCVAGTAENSALITVINKGLSMISESERNGIIMDTTILNPYRTSIWDVLYKYRIPMIVILVLFLAVIGVLAALIAVKRRSEGKLKAALDKEQEAHEQKKTALTLAEQASAAKGNFMSRMSHEIRTPLNAVIGYNTIARSEMAGARTDAERRQADMKVMDCLTKSDVASRHLLTIINDVLDMSAIESGRITVVKERFDFKGLISSLTAVFYSQAKAKNVELEVVFDTLAEEWLVGDQMRLNQILTNLLSNAVKFTPEGGSVKLSVCQAETQADAARIRFTVRDTGIGMTEEYLRHIWTPFEQADSSISRRFGGTGLGLSITKNLVDLMDGVIQVESAPGKGSTFTVELPFMRTEQPQNSGVYDFRHVNALVVDDDAGTCDYVRLLFTRCGARCASAGSGEEAIDVFQRAQTRGEPFTLCLVDWRMPKMDGIETVKRLRELGGSDIPIIVITAYDYSEIAEKAATVGVQTFIAKPLFQSSLFNLLANICGRPEAAAQEKPASYDFAGARVLLAEDNAMNMEIARRLLEAAHLTVDTVWNGREAVDKFTAAPAGTYRAILMDVQMPVMDGHSATRAIRASGHPEAETVPILAMTADAFAENVAEALASGMNGHIAKPIDIATLFEMLGRHIGPGA